MLVNFLPIYINPTPRAGTTTPADPKGTYSWAANGFIKVRRVGGSRAQGIDRPRVVLEFYAPDEIAAATLGDAVSALFDGPILSLRTTDGAVIGAQTDSAPSWVPYDDVRVKRYQSHHTLVVHSMK
jgi:hypothetical protein